MILLLCLLPISADAASVQLNKTNLKLSIDKTYTMKIKGTNAKVKWSSTKKSVATVSSKGVVKAKAPGKAKIKAKANKTYNIVWNGKRNGKVVAPGTYTAVVKAGICELNEGNISNCYSSGRTAVADGVFENKGIV